MVQILTPDGKPFYLPPSSEAQRSWQLARRSAQLQNNIAHAEQSIARANQPFRPPGSTGQTVNPDGSTITHYGPDGSKTTSPSGRSTYQPGPRSPFRAPTTPTPGSRTAPNLRTPASYAPVATQQRPAIPPIRSRGVPRPPQAIPRAVGRMGTAGAASGIASGVLAAGATALAGGTMGQTIGAGVGGTVGTIGGAAAGAAIGSVFGPAGTVVGGYVGGAVGGAVGSGVGGWLGGVLDPPAQGGISGPEVTSPPSGTIPYDPAIDLRDKDLLPGYGGVRIRFQATGAPSNPIGVTSFSFEQIPEGAPRFGTGQVLIRFTTCSGSSSSSYTFPDLVQVLSAGACAPQTEPIPTGDRPANPPRIISGFPPIFDTPDSFPPPVSTPEGTPPYGSDPAFPGGPRPGGNTPPAATRPVPSSGSSPIPPPNDRPNSPTGDAPDRVPSTRPRSAGTTTTSRGLTDTNRETGQPELQSPDAAEQANLDPAASDGLDQFDDRAIYDGQRYIPGSEATEAQKNGFQMPFPIPLGMPVGAPRAGDYPRVQGAPTGATRLRPGGTTGTQVQTPEPPKPPPPPKTGNPCGCNVQIMKKLDTMSGAQGANLGAQGANLAAILSKLNQMQQFAEKAWETTRIQKVIDALTLLTVLHNAAFLSREIKETLLFAVSQALNVIGIDDEEGNPLDLNQMLNNTIEQFLKNALGEEVYNDTKVSWQKANRILQVGSSIIWSIRSIGDSTQEVVEYVAENTGKIGNALRRWGVVNFNAYGRMAERVQAGDLARRRTRRMMEGLEAVDDSVSAFANAASEVNEITEEISYLREQSDTFKQSVSEFDDHLGEENTPDNSFLVEREQADLQQSPGPEVQPSDLERVEP